MQRLKPRFNHYVINKDPQRGYLASFYNSQSYSRVSFAHQSSVRTVTFNTKAFTVYSLSAIEALRQIHPRLHERDKMLLDQAAAEIRRRTAQDDAGQAPSSTQSRSHAVGRQKGFWARMKARFK